MEHIEEAGIHSGDSACALPPITLGRADLERIRTSTLGIAAGVGVRGLLNVQYALKDDVLYVLEANPRASRTVPFVSKATAVPVAKAAARIMLGATVAELRAEGAAADDRRRRRPAVRRADLGEGGGAAVRPLPHLAGEGVDTVLGPEMKSTGEVMGIDSVFGTAYAKSQAAAYGELPTKGRVFVSVANRDKRAMLFPVKRLADLGFEVLATEGTAEVLRRNGVPTTVVGKHSQGRGDDVVPLHPGRRGRPRPQHAVRHRRRAATATRSAPPPCSARRPVHHDDPGRGGLRAGHRGAGARRHRRDVAAGAPRRPAASRAAAGGSA